MDDYMDLEVIDLNDYETISGQLFKYGKAPFMNIFPKEISFSNEARGMFNFCQAIRMMINEQKKTIAIRPMSPSEGNILIWVKEGQKRTYIPTYSCPKLTGHLYRIWGWDPEYRYKSYGNLVHYAGKPLILFDFSKAEKHPSTWEGLQNARKK